VLTRHVAEIARDLQGARGAQETAELAVRVCVEAIDGCEDAGFSLFAAPGLLTTTAATTPRLGRLEELQQAVGAGPAFSAVHDEDVVSVSDLERERRWTGWASRAALDTGIRALVCARLFDEGAPVGVLTLASSRPDAFSDEDVDDCRCLAALTSMALSTAQHAEQAEATIESRNQIGQAQGILMERFSIDASRALAVLKRMSRHSHRTLREVAAEIAATGDLPDTSEPATLP
jgi:GAF domain-containing protein